MTDLERDLGRPPEADFDPDALLETFRRRAAQAGLLDVAYSGVESPLGPITVFVTPRGLVRVTYQDERLDDVLDEVASRVSPRVIHAPDQTDAVRRELDDYFAGRRRAFDVPVDWRLVRGFGERVLRATAAVPYGQVTTYREVAGAAGSPRAYRAAGNALHTNPIPIVVPCHRVLHSGGGLGGYAGGLDRKRYLLGLEGALPAG